MLTIAGGIILACILWLGIILAVGTVLIAFAFGLLALKRIIIRTPKSAELTAS